ncbi:hypothetical protein C1646_767986 [Rhizophagus diaphanus]|nr:hypothetical protein C1646_767986 [Rhizophagus diaphanus] [Rhizophagus sp. MUCL 43196]
MNLLQHKSSSSNIIKLKLAGLQIENRKLRADNIELQYRVDKLNKELEESKELNEMLIKINKEFEKENDTLYEQINFYKNLQMPRNSDDEIFDMDVEMDKKDEKDDKDTRVNENEDHFENYACQIRP